VKGFFSRDYEPTHSLEPGDAVSFHALNAAWCWEREDEPSRPEGAGHALAGPFEVRGANAGATLVVHVDEVVPRPWGATWAHGERFDWTLEGETWRMKEHEARSAPFLGVIGLPPPEPGEHSTGPPRTWGGNIDCKLLVAGTTLYLPIPVDGALLMAGDCHGAQGHGEVSGTAIECPLERATLRLDVLDLELRSPIARTDDAWLAFGFDEDLDLAAEHAMATMLDLMEREMGIPRREALALSSVAVDLHVTQIVNGAKGVHAILPAWRTSSSSPTSAKG
jgi:acetamidase/formamidase